MAEDSTIAQNGRTVGDDSQVLDLRDYLAVLGRRKWYVAGVTALVVAVAITVTALQTPIYEATSELVVEPIGTGGDMTALERAIFGSTELETQRKIVTSASVAMRVLEDLGLEPTRAAAEEILDQVEVTLVRDTQILEITATDEDPEAAAALSQAFAEAYLEHRRADALERVLGAAADLEQRTAGIRERLDELAIDARRAAEGTSEAGAIEQERASLLAELGRLAAQSSSLEAADSFVRGGGEIIRSALVPEAPSSPKPLRTGVLALVLGLMLGVGLAFLRDTLDDAVRDDDDVRRVTGRPVLAHIPRWGDGDDVRLATLVAPSSAVAEAYRALRTNLRYLLAGKDAGARATSIVVTSPVESEGKTTTTANLAIAAARAGMRVILVDADLRRPTQHHRFGITEGPGLSELLVGEVDMPDALRTVGVQNLRVLPAGTIPPNPAELLSSVLMERVRHGLEGLADLVIYDSPPVLAVADALELAAVSTLTVLVADHGTSRRRPLAAAADRIAGVGARLAGTVLNNVDMADTYYGYSRGYYAAVESDQEIRSAPARTATRRPAATGADERPIDQTPPASPADERPIFQAPAERPADEARADETAPAAPAERLPAAPDRRAPSVGGSAPNGHRQQPRDTPAEPTPWSNPGR